MDTGRAAAPRRALGSLEVVWAEAIRVLLAPRLLILHVLAILATSVAVGLGVWQYDAWQERRAAEAEDLADVPAVPLTRVMGADDPFPGNAVGRPVTLEGSWVPGSTFYVADRQLAGETGYWAVTPLAVCPGGCPADAASPALLVVRGWTTDPAEAPRAPEGTVALEGWLQPPEGGSVTDAEPNDDVLPQLRIADAIQRVDQDLYGAYLVAREPVPSDRAGESATPLRTVTPESLPEPETFTALRNLLYALEWWVFALFALVVWVRWCRDELANHRAGAPVGVG